MIHTIIIEIFKQNFPQYKDNITEWYPNGKNSIRVKLKDKTEIVYTHNSDRNWSLESKKHFINKLNEQIKLVERTIESTYKH